MPVVGLDLHHRFRFLADVLQVVLEPAEELHRPIHAAHVRVGFPPVAGRQLAVTVGLVGVVVGPLTGDGPGVDPGVPHQLVGWERVVRVDVPVLQPPHEVNAATVVFEHVREVAALVPIVVPAVPTDFRSGPRCERVEGSDGIVGAHAQVVVGRIGRGAFVQGVVEHGAALGRTVAVEHLLNADGAGDGDDGFEMGRGVLRRLPIGGASVGFAHQADVTVRPCLFAEPLHDGLDAHLFAQAFDVLAVGGLPGAKGGGLGQGVTVRDEGVVDPLPHAAVGDGVGIGVRTRNAFPTEVVVRMDGHDDGHLGAFGYIRQPQRHVHQIRAWEAGVLLAGGQRHFHKVLLVRQCFIGPVFGELGPQGVHGQLHGVTVLERCVPPVARERSRIAVVHDGGLCAHGHHQEDDGDGGGGSAAEVHLAAA